MASVTITVSRVTEPAVGQLQHWGTYSDWSGRDQVLKIIRRKNTIFFKRKCKLWDIFTIFEFIQEIQIVVVSNG